MPGPTLPFDLTDLDNFARGFPHDLFVAHRRDFPVAWQEPTRHTPDGEGFWSVSTHGETMQVLRDPITFSSEGGPGRPAGGTLIPDLPAAGRLLNMMDDPRHRRVRQLVSGGLTPRTISRVEDELRRRTSLLLGSLAGGEGDFMVDVAGELPMQAISILLGTPEEDRKQLFEWVHYSFDFDARDAWQATDEVRAAAASMWAYGAKLIEEKRAHPTDDMLSAVIHGTMAGEDPPRLSDEEVQMFFSLLFSAGADTTRNAAGGGLLALIENPGELRRLERDRSLLSTGIDEMVRWTSPAAYNRRTATCDADLGPARIRAGEKVVFWEASANRDESVFEDPMGLHVDRDPNPHVGFGHGAHHCLGANLARLEMRVIFEGLLGRYTGFELAGPVEWTRSNKHTGIRHLPVRCRPR